MAREIYFTHTETPFRTPMSFQCDTFEQFAYFANRRRFLKRITLIHGVDEKTGVKISIAYESLLPPSDSKKRKFIEDTIDFLHIA